jgi:hypothetical protein
MRFGVHPHPDTITELLVIVCIAVIVHAGGERDDVDWSAVIGE